MSDSGKSDFAGYTRNRRPASWPRQVIGLLMLLVVATGIGAYWRLTDEDRLQQYAQVWLQDFTGGETRIDRVEFDLFRGLHLIGVTIALPEEAEFDPFNNSLERRTVFRSSTVFLRLRPMSIVSGELVVPEIVAVNPELILAERVTDDVGNWEVMLAGRSEMGGMQTGQGELPTIRLRNVRVRQFQIDETGRSGGIEQVFYADAQPMGRREPLYDLHVTKIVPSETPGEMVGEEGRLKINLATRAVSGSLPSLSMEELLIAAPPEVQRWLDVLQVRGYVRADTFEFDPEHGGSATLTLRDAGLQIPFDVEEAGHVEPYVQFSQVQGTIRFEGSDAAIELDGRFRDSPIRVAGDLTLPADVTAGLSGIGFNLEVTGQEIELPSKNEAAPASERQFVARWPKLVQFLDEFEPTGQIDLSLELFKAPGAQMGVQFVEGSMQLRNVSAAYFRFPYRVNGVNGEVRFLSDGQVELHDVAGHHGEGTVLVNGWLERNHPTAPARFDIRGKNIALEEDVLVCLGEQERELTEEFLSAATMDIRVDLTRDAARPGEVKGKWHSEIDVDFLDGAVNVRGFEALMTDLTGRMHIGDGAATFDNLQAKRGDSAARLDGSAEVDSAGDVKADLRLEATHVKLDDDLARAFIPDQARQAYERMNLNGIADVTARLFNDAIGEPIRYDMDAQITNAQLRIFDNDLLLTDAAADIRLKNEALVIESLQGKVRSDAVRLTGRLPLTADGGATALHLKCDRLNLDEKLQASLPEQLAETLTLFSARGPIGLDVQYEQPPSDASGSKTPPNYTAVVDPKGCEVTFEHFPLPLTDVTGRLRITPERTRIESLSARHDQATCQFTGTIEYGTDAFRVDVRGKAKNLNFSESLRNAVPWRLKRLWNDLKPAGRIDLDITQATYTKAEDPKGRWEFAGRADLSEVSLTVGPKLTETSGQIDNIRCDIDDRFAISGDIRLDHVKVDGRPLTNVTARMDRPADVPVFRVTDILGELAGGQVIGDVEIDYARKTARMVWDEKRQRFLPPEGDAAGTTNRPHYGVTLTAREVSLQQFLNATRSPGAEPIRLKGQVQGNLALTGRFGDPELRRGSGAIVITHAQMLKIPLVLAILQVIHLAVDDDNAFHDATFRFAIDGDMLILEEIDLRGKALSMVGGGRVAIPTQTLDLILLVGSPLKLPRLAILSEFVEGVARELMVVRVTGTLENPEYQADVAQSLRKTLDTILNLRRPE